MNLLVNTSFIASFFAGVAALFAPCCVTVLLPTYLASVFKQKVTVILMTFIYFLGLLTVFLPLGLGATILSQLFSQYHNSIFSFGAAFLIFLGLALILGKQLSLPFSIHPELKNTDPVSVYILGIFSGAATTCCAPVLAGVLAISALPGSVLLGALYTMTYVLGMVVPLFVIAAFLDKINFTQKFFVFRKRLSYRLFGQMIQLTWANLFSGTMFLGLGIMILALSKNNDLTSHSSYQLDINIYLTKTIQFISSYTRYIPEVFWALFFTAVLCVIIFLTIKQYLKLIKKKDEVHENEQV